MDILQFQQFAPNLHKQLLEYEEKDFWNLFLSFAGQTRVLFLGEIHGTNDVPILAQKLLLGLKKVGFSLLALEIPNYHQESIKLFLETGNIQDLQREFAPKWQSAHYQTSSHIQLVYRAHHLGYRLGFFGLSKNQSVENEIDRDTHFSDNFLTLWKSFGYPKTVVYCGVSHASYEDRRMANLLKQEVKSLSIICEASRGHFLDLGRVERFGADAGMFGRLIGRIRPDIKFGFFDLRYDSNLRKYGDGIVYIKKVSASSLPKQGFFRRLIQGF